MRPWLATGELENVLRAVSLFAEGATITAADVIDNVEDLRAIAQSGPASQAPVSIRSVSVLPPAPSVAASEAPERAAVSGEDDEEGGLLPEDEANATANQSGINTTWIPITFGFRW